MKEWKPGEVRYTTCMFCDGGCRVRAEMRDGELRLSPADPAHPAICGKIGILDEYRGHPDRVLHPLRNVGRRGEPVWEQVGWDEALDGIAARLKKVADEHGPEAIAFAETPLNLGYGAITRRLMNCLGTPNYTAPVELCSGNTSQVHRAVYGWRSDSDWEAADCIVYFGQNRGPELWPREWLKLKDALARGAKLVVVDPRETETARLADWHLRIRYGTDAALLLGWIGVIISEGLYDRAFVEESCTGFARLAERAAAWPPERAAEVCGITADEVVQTARLYATSRASIMPWGATLDMQANSTSALQAQCILRAICGFLGKSELFAGPHDGAVPLSKLEATELLPQAKRDLQLGADEHPLLTFRASALYREATARYVDYEPDLVAESHACVPTALWRAMRGEGPYPVKAIVSAGNNTVMSYAGQEGIVRAFLNQDLAVSFEHWLTPTAQLCDYVLPGDMWAERDVMGWYDCAPVFLPGQALLERPGECRSWYAVVKGLADRLGYADMFPWEDERELFDWQLAPLGLSFADACAQLPRPVLNRTPALGKFVTPSGKVELASSVLEALGFDPLPDYREPQDPGAAGGDFPYVAFAGAREEANYNTNLRQIASLREKGPRAELYLNPRDAAREGIGDGDMCAVASAYGQMRLRARIDAGQPEGTLRVPHGWWRPEGEPGLAAGLSGARAENDGELFPDGDFNLDPAQGLPNLRGGIHVRVERA